MSESDSTRTPNPLGDRAGRYSKRRGLSKHAIRAKLEGWIAQLHSDPTAEERAADERRALLLRELDQTIRDAPDDVPIKYVIERLNRHWED